MRSAGGAEWYKLLCGIAVLRPGTVEMNEWADFVRNTLRVRDLVLRSRSRSLRSGAERSGGLAQVGTADVRTAELHSLFLALDTARTGALDLPELFTFLRDGTAATPQRSRLAARAIHSPTAAAAAAAVRALARGVAAQRLHRPASLPSGPDAADMPAALQGRSSARRCCARCTPSCSRTPASRAPTGRRSGVRWRTALGPIKYRTHTSLPEPRPLLPRSVKRAGTGPPMRWSARGAGAHACGCAGAGGHCTCACVSAAIRRQRSVCARDAHAHALHAVRHH